MRKFLFTGILCLFQLLLPANSVIIKAASEVSNLPGKEWRTEYRDSDLLIEACLNLYEDSGFNHERVVFRYTNLSKNKLSVSFNRTSTYNGVCYGCDKQDKKFLIELEPSEAKEFSKENKDKTYYIFAKDLKNTIKKSLDSYQIVNIEKQVK